MNRFFIFLIFLVSHTMCLVAQDYIEAFNILTEDISTEVHDAKIIRPINGGTVIIPEFDVTCPEDIKAPFSYACKIVEEYMPPCLPLRVKVSCGRINSSASGAISKVLAQSKEDFGTFAEYRNVPMSVIKGVILKELLHNSTASYLDHVPDVAFLTQYPDIEITYNSQKLPEISFSLDPSPGQNYDFVSLAVRDLLIGLGLSSSFRVNPITNDLLDPSHQFTPFETYIDGVIGNAGNPTARLIAATKGELVLRKSVRQSLKLYAPSSWKNGQSLNYFIPQEDCDVTKILSYDFSKGLVTRSLADNYNDFIFNDLLGWKANYLTGTNSSSFSTGGSTSLIMPYNGSMTYNNTTYASSVELISPKAESFPVLQTLQSGQNEDLNNYIAASILYMMTHPLR